jgi:hypothetical protein
VRAVIFQKRAPREATPASRAPRHDASGVISTYTVDYLPRGGGSPTNRNAIGMKSTYAVHNSPIAAGSSLGAPFFGAKEAST